MERRGSPSLHRRVTATGSVDIKSNSRVKLDQYYVLLYKTILDYQVCVRECHSG